MQGSPDKPGIIPRSLEHVIALAQEYRKKNKNSQVAVCVSYAEIYNEKVYDLLQPKDQDLPIREGKDKNIFIPSLEQVSVHSIDDFHKTYDLGCSNRTTAATKLNAKSSRSHAILMVNVSISEGGRTLVGKLHLIDLAGSEDNRRTENTGIRLTESSNINQSLFVLGKVVNALNKGQVCLIYTCIAF
jgi:kinesin family protein 22